MRKANLQDGALSSQTGASKKKKKLNGSGEKCIASPYSTQVCQDKGLEGDEGRTLSEDGYPLLQVALECGKSCFGVFPAGCFVTGASSPVVCSSYWNYKMRSYNLRPRDS